jgi:lipoprotein
MGAIATKRQLQAALALTLLACSGLSGCSGGQEQGAANTGSTKAAVATAHAKTPSATPKASGKARASGVPAATGTPTVTGTPSATASPTLIMTPELEASKKRALATPPPPKPELITVNSDDGAIATAKYWVQLHYYIYTTGKVDEYKALCPGDGFIATTPVKHATENHAKGGWTDPIAVKFTSAFRRDDFKNEVVIQVDFEREPYTHYNSNGEIEYNPKQSRYAGVKLEYNGSQWIVKEAFNRED